MDMWCLFHQWTCISCGTQNMEGKHGTEHPVPSWYPLRSCPMQSHLVCRVHWTTTSVESESSDSSCGWLQLFQENCCTGRVSTSDFAQEPLLQPLGSVVARAQEYQDAHGMRLQSITLNKNILHCEKHKGISEQPDVNFHHISIHLWISLTWL